MKKDEGNRKIVGGTWREGKSQKNAKKLKRKKNRSEITTRENGLEHLCGICMRFLIIVVIHGRAIKLRSVSVLVERNMPYILCIYRGSQMMIPSVGMCILYM